MMKHATVRQLVRAVKQAATLIGTSQATYCFEGRMALPLAAGWSLVISPDDAERLRVQACHSGRVRATMWVRADDEERLAELVSAAQAEAAALVA